jgi:hypothetical protein
MKNKISLPCGGPKAEFEAEELINHYKSQNIDYLIIGAIHVALVNHKKQHSLHVWLRNHHNVKSYHKNTCHATSEVISRLKKLKQFSVGKRKCLTTNRMCKSLIISKI